MEANEVLARILEDEPEPIASPFTIRKQDNRETFEALSFVDKARVKKDIRFGGFKIHPVEVKQGRLAATDGHRIHFTPVKDIPDGLYEVSKQGNTYILYPVKDFVRYPDISEEMAKYPKGQTTSLDRKDFLRCARQAKILTDANYAGIILSFNGKLEVRAIHPDIGDMETETETSSRIEPEISLGINAKYLLEALQGLKSKTVDVQVNAPDNPIILTDKVNTAFIMPMRL